MAVTVAQLLDRVRQKVGARDTLNKLNGAIATVGAATGIMEFATTGIAEGVRLSIDLEDLYVWSKVDATKVVTWERGVNGSTAAIHADDSLVRVGPQFSPFDILTAVNDELVSLPGEGVARHRTVTLSSSSATGYDMTGIADFLRVTKVAYEDAAVSNFRPINRRYWRVDQDVPVADFASGSALFIFDQAPQGVSVQVSFTAPFVALTTLAQDVATISFLPERAVPLVAVGAAIRLTAGRASARASIAAQGATRRAEEVSTNDTRVAQSPLYAEYDRLLRAERRAQAMEGRE